MNSSHHAARVAVLKHSFADDRLGGRKSTKKLDFNARLCPKVETTIRHPPDTSIVANFGISEKTAPPEIFKQGTTHRINQLHTSCRLAMVRFRVGEQEGVSYADIISTDLQAGRYSWTDDIIAKVSNKIAKNIQSMGFAGVGGLQRLAFELGQNHDWRHQLRLFDAIKTEFGNILPLKEEPYFSS
jgi:hypothetical protein